MMDFLKELKEKKILTQKDVDSFKSYIDKKYGSLEDEKKEAILRDSIAHVVNRDLAELKMENEEGLVHFFVEKILLENKEDLYADRFFEAVIADRTPCDVFYQNLRKWINDRIQNPLPQDLLHKYYEDNFNKNTSLADSPPLTEKNSFAPLWTIWIGLAIITLSLFFTFSSAPSQPTTIAPMEKSIDTPSLPAYVLLRHKIPNRNIPDYLHYHAIDQEGLKEYLTSRNSLLRNEPYFSQIMDTAKEFDLHPLLLFAIVGHEQAFVPEDHPYSTMMVNNPFNVYGSWERYNTTLKHSAEIASRTIYTSLSDLPPYMDPFFWINRRYAEDPNWWKGVRSIFWTLHN
ncbi:hypothetical protein SAMN05660297_01444 [Natronincola peptidivorans]|uniref:Mannosyl-glycoprotein endo-beta-N-acetylglucosaminidase n=1 Tax=Natronincola peptidivorans TaxID=426128 RepID=A0A1I0BWH2_9FIRM|nr:hypothetical protein [Natronincola peptidivorans]SET11189.1 hypothetical protein SAMN05660297_01444 [Natronincola peptidivorans]